MTKIRFMMRLADGLLELNEEWGCYYSSYDKTWNLEQYDENEVVEEREWELEKFEEFLVEVEKIKPISEILESD